MTRKLVHQVAMSMFKLGIGIVGGFILLILFGFLVAAFSKHGLIGVFLLGIYALMGGAATVYFLEVYEDEK